MLGLKIYVINLDRRKDRLLKVSSQLSSNGLTFTRIPAVDQLKIPNKIENNSIIGQGYVANWLSHQAVLKLIAMGNEKYGLVLEDDADLRVISFNSERLDKVCALMDKEGIDLLQIGYISQFYSLPNLRGVVETILNLIAGRMSWAPTISGWVVTNSYRGGAHAYIVSRKMANQLLGLNIPTALATDPFYASLATNSSQVLIARLARSWIEQDSRKGRQSIDSDVD